VKNPDSGFRRNDAKKNQINFFAAPLFQRGKKWNLPSALQKLSSLSKRPVESLQVEREDGRDFWESLFKNAKVLRKMKIGVFLRPGSRGGF
jgi:hypothetical protein